MTKPATLGVSLICCFFLFHSFSFAQQQQQKRTVYFNSTELKRLAFGSCNDQKKAQDWEAGVISTSPDVWLWLGDVVYADKTIVPLFRLPAGKRELSESYRRQLSHPEYIEFKQRIPLILGTWDDHDYGKNDGGAEYEERTFSQQEFLRFLDEPADSVRWREPGLYHAYVFGSRLGRRVKLVLLDTRSFKRPGELLGEVQWEWLEQVLAPETLREEGIALLLLGSSIQLLPAEKPVQEKWAAAARASRARLLSLLLRAQAASAVLILSGDVHYGELLRFEERCGGLLEATSSGLTHSCAGDLSARVCRAVLESGLFRSRYHVPGSYIFDRHFATLDIDLEHDLAPRLLIAFRNASGDVLLQFLVDLPRSEPLASKHIARWSSSSPLFSLSLSLVFCIL
jgi:alkaline phosphatase D